MQWVSVALVGFVACFGLGCYWLGRLNGRRRGIELAGRITDDLRRERNRAVADDQKHTAILQSIADAVLAVDAQGRILLFNPAAQRISGYAEHEALGKPYHSVLRFEHRETGKPQHEFIAQALAGKQSSMSKQTILVCKDGSRVAVADSASPILGDKGRVEGAIVVFRDISEDDELDHAKTEFVSLASHKLRTPLSAINWYGEMLLNGDAGKLNEKQQEYLAAIFEGNQRMVELVDSLLDVSRIEVGKLPNRPEPTDVGAITGNTVKEFATNIATRPLTVTQDIVPLKQPVFADPKQLHMILQNLISNAIKYTPSKGSVHITLREATPQEIAAANLPGDQPRWFFSVRDTGYGIPKSQQGRIFAKLFRADNVRMLDTNGTGLGLYIVKELVERMGGRVWFDSVESVGTTFYVVLPHTAPGAAYGTITAETPS